MLWIFHNFLEQCKLGLMIVRLLYQCELIMKFKILLCVFLSQD